MCTILFLKYLGRSKEFVVKKILVLDDVLESDYSCETPTRFGLLAQMASRSPFASISKVNADDEWSPCLQQIKGILWVREVNSCNLIQVFPLEIDNSVGVDLIPNGYVFVLEPPFDLLSCWCSQ